MNHLRILRSPLWDMQKTPGPLSDRGQIALTKESRSYLENQKSIPARTKENHRAGRIGKKTAPAHEEGLHHMIFDE